MGLRTPPCVSQVSFLEMALRGVRKCQLSVFCLSSSRSLACALLCPFRRCRGLKSGAGGQITFLIEVTMWSVSAGRDSLEFKPQGLGTGQHPQVHCFEGNVDPWK